MKRLSLVLICCSFVTNIFASSTYIHCQSLYGEIEFLAPKGSKHLFLAPHSLISNQRQIASLKSGSKADITQWETLHYTSLNNKNLWSQKSLSFKSDFNKYVEVSLQDGKTHTFSLKCSNI